MSLDVTLMQCDSEFMFKSLEDYAKHTDYLTDKHPFWEAFKIVWTMSRSRMEKDTGTQVFDANITHNLGNMADAAGIYLQVWNPEKVGITRAGQLVDHLREGIAKLKADPDGFRKYNAPNGWGLYEHFVPWLEKYLEACIKNPDAIIMVSR